VTKVAKHWKTAGLNSKDHALCAFAEKLTLNPDSMLKKILENWRTWDSLIQRFMMQIRF
jgi:alkylhydroperoxidase family enzyme